MEASNIWSVTLGRIVRKNPDCILNTVPDAVPKQQANTVTNSLLVIFLKYGVMIIRDSTAKKIFIKPDRNSLPLNFILC